MKLSSQDWGDIHLSFYMQIAMKMVTPKIFLEVWNDLPFILPLSISSNVAAGGLAENEQSWLHAWLQGSNI